MRNLLSAGASRLWRSKMLWLCCGVMVVMGVMPMVGAYRDNIRFNHVEAIDQSFFMWSPLSGFLSALVCTFFIGPEYGDGTMRNKVIAGCRRRDIYLVNLSLSCLAALVMCLSAIVPALAVGLPLLGGFRMGALRAALLAAGVVVLTMAYASTFTMLAMLVHRRTAAAVAAMVTALAMLMAGAYINGALQEPPEYMGYTMTVDGTLALADPTPNPRYVPEGPARDALELAFILLPGGQTVSYADMSVSDPPLLMALDAVWIIVTTAAGLVLFRRKDLK